MVQLTAYNSDYREKSKNEESEQQNHLHKKVLDSCILVMFCDALNSFYVLHDAYSPFLMDIA